MLVGVKLLDKTRKISRLLHNNSSFVVVFNDICKCVGDILSANVLVVSAKGKVLGVYEKDDIPSLQEMLTDNVGEHIDADLNERFLSVLSTKENSNLTTLGFEKASDSDYTAVILPIDFAGGRLGTTFIYRLKKEFSVDDIILSEYANTVIELEMMRSIYEENVEEKRQMAAIDAAISALSDSEKKAVMYTLDMLNEDMEGTIVVSHISKTYGITRSIIVNAIHKMESAGILLAQSKGMRGTFIKVVNPAIFTEITSQKDSNN